ncbi:MAG: response regulator [Candidatus Margulisiibacteriota bacterium]
MKKKIIIIDDECQFSSLLSFRLIKTFDCEVLTADNGAEGITSIEKNLPDLIILDLLMPVMDGLAVLQYLSSNLKLNRIPVIVLTASNTPESRSKILEYKMVAEIYYKPVNQVDLTNKIKELLNK